MKRCEGSTKTGRCSRLARTIVNGKHYCLRCAAHAR